MSDLHFPSQSLTIFSLCRGFNGEFCPRECLTAQLSASILFIQLIQPVRDQFPNLIIHHMDDILITVPSQDILVKTASFLKNSVASAGLVIAPEKNPALRTLEIFRLYPF